MVAPVDRPRGVLAGTFGVGILTFLLLPSEVGYQDLAALIARDAAVVERPQKSSLASSFGTIHAANLNLPQPVGSGITPALGYTLASLDPGNAELTGSIRERILRESALMLAPDAAPGPWVDRSRKSDQLTATRRNDNVAVKGDRLGASPVQQAKTDPAVEAEASLPQVAAVPSIEGGAEVEAPANIEAERFVAAEKQLADAVERAAKIQVAALPAPRDGNEAADGPQPAERQPAEAPTRQAKPDVKSGAKSAGSEVKPTRSKETEKSRATRQASSKSTLQAARTQRDAESRSERIAREARQKTEKLARSQSAPKPAEGAATLPADVAILEQGQATPTDFSTPQVGPAPSNGFVLASAGDHRIGLDTRQFERDTAPAVAAPAVPGSNVAPAVASGKADALPTANAIASAEGSPTQRKSRLFFGGDPMGRKVGSIEPWKPGAAPRFDNGIMSDVATGAETTKGAEIKLAALPPVESAIDHTAGNVPGQNVRKDSSSHGGQSIAPKGEVTGADKRPMTPAERLGLSDEKSRAKSVKCLTEAIYFESRGEQVRGQMAVAQVILNRAFSGKYPPTVCGVVYQNAHRHLACQFTFACDGIADRVKEPDMWERATVIANEMLDGKIWLPEIGKATHYHAYWVSPGWVRTMNKLHRVGVHTFYRPRNWGDGESAPQWGDQGETQEVAKKLVEVARKP